MQKCWVSRMIPAKIDHHGESDANGSMPPWIGDGSAARMIFDKLHKLPHSADCRLPIHYCRIICTGILALCMIQCLLFFIVVQFLELDRCLFNHIGKLSWETGPKFSFMRQSIYFVPAWMCKVSVSNTRRIIHVYQSVRCFGDCFFVSCCNAARDQSIA